MNEHLERIKNLRIDNDLYQTDVAAVIGTTQQYYGKYENGEHYLPLRALIKLADYYGVSTDYLLARTKCKEGVDGLNRALAADLSTGDVISSILSLSDQSRVKALDYIKLLAANEQRI